MKIQTRILSTLLAVLFIVSSLTFIGTFAVGAEEVKDDFTTEKGVASYYLKDHVFKTPQEKLDTMEVVQEKYGYKLYADPHSGEVALVETATGNFLFSNPYDVASSKGSDQFKSGSNGTKEQLLMSQIVIQYVDNGTTKYLYSFQDAAMKGQISMSRIKSGVRMEYTIGQEAFRKLVPRWITVENFTELIQKPILEAVERGEMGGIPKPTATNPNPTAADNFYFRQFMSFYTLQDPEQATTQAQLESMNTNFPITKTGQAIYVFEATAASIEVDKEENYIRQYCADTYSFEQMDADHELTGYEATDDEYPVFKLALEYSLDETGLSVRMPCNGLQYNMASYTMENISILPYMGAGNTKNEGYNFYPDGSGSLFDFNLNRTNTIRGKIYGTDYAYHQISGTYQKAIRVPVYGTVATEVIYNYSYSKPEYDSAGTPVLNADGTLKMKEYSVEVSNTVQSKEDIEKLLAEDDVVITKPLTEKSYQRGYVAVIEAGESLGEIETYFAGALSDYATMSNYFNPKPKDSYDIADSISVTSSSTWTVVSNRKYTGNIRIHYQLLCDEKIGSETQAKDSGYTYYEASWLGMAEAYRDYLLKKGTLTKLSDADVQKDIPLYMEVFGALETQQTIATMPVNVMTPLTTFEDMLTMYDELSKEGVNNINFKMTGFANGGMYSKIPSSLKWEKKVGGKSGFKDLVAKAEEINSGDGDKNIGLYPDFDFAYSSMNTLFDSLDLKKDAIKTIDNRYTSKRQYSATQQKYVSFYQLAISPSRYNKFYNKLMKNYDKYGLKTMSVASLGTALNSDFDEDDPYNREDSKEFTVKAFEDLKKNNYCLMTDGGNAYTWGYVDHIINMDLDSSRYVKASATVPFVGAALHGYVQFAGTALNKEGDTDYAMLKAIENGAGMYFILSYRNTQELKEDEILSQNYSIRYDIWKNDVVGYYNTLNSLMNDVQTMNIIAHKFLNYNATDANGNKYLTERVLDSDELERDLLEELKKAEEAAKEQEKNEAINNIAVVANARIALRQASATISEIMESLETLNATLSGQYQNVVALMESMKADPNRNTLNELHQKTIDLWNAYERAEYQFTLADEQMKVLQAQLELIRVRTEGNASIAYQYTEASQQFAAAEQLLANAKSEQSTVYATMVEASGKTTFPEAFDAMIAEAAGVVAEFNTANPGSPLSTTLLDLEQIKAEGKYEPETVEQTETVTTDPRAERYHVSNNSVVAVTYGTVDETTHQKTAYKTFILNYNSYAVRVTYNGVIYTVPGGGYVALMA